MVPGFLNQVATLLFLSFFVPFIGISCVVCEVDVLEVDVFVGASGVVDT